MVLFSGFLFSDYQHFLASEREAVVSDPAPVDVGADQTLLSISASFKHPSYNNFLNSSDDRIIRNLLLEQILRNIDVITFIDLL